jgi:hypothetical protein
MPRQATLRRVLEAKSLRWASFSVGTYAPVRSFPAALPSLRKRHLTEHWVEEPSPSYSWAPTGVKEGFRIDHG